MGKEILLLQWLIIWQFTVGMKQMHKLRDTTQY